MINYIVNLLINLLPSTRLFSLKRFLLSLTGAIIAKNVRVCSSAKFIGNGKLIIDENSWIGHECLVIKSSSVSIGKNVDIAPRVYIGTGTHFIDMNSLNVAGEGFSKDIIIGDGVWIGANSTILPGVKIGKKSIIGAGSVVVKEIPPYCIAVGNPCKPIKIWNQKKQIFESI
jgi:acetyltransferase-like isoleucine patch superfamily enzyme